MGRGTAAELARHARLAHDLDTALDASIRAGDEAMAVAGPDEAAHHYEQALELLADPRAALHLRDRHLQARGQRRRGADHLGPADPGRRAAGRAARRSWPPDAPPAWRARMLAARADAVMLTENVDDQPARPDPGGRRPAARGTPAGCGPRCSPPRPGCSPATGRYDEAQVAGLDALALAERLDLHELASDVITTLSNLKKAGPKDALRSALVEAVAPGGRHRRHPGRAPRPLLPGPLLRGLGRVGAGRDAGSAAP